MCSFLLTNLPGLLLRFALVNRLMQRRGPDATTTVYAGGIHFVHNLLHMSGAITPQPIRGSSGRVLIQFNGEIYNYKGLKTNAASDGESVLSAYLQWGPLFARRLDGEFAIAVADLEKGTFVLAVDPFGTKPLYYGRFGSGFAIASYASALRPLIGQRAIRAVPPNTILVFDKKMRLLERRVVFEFDLRQWKGHALSWTSAFEDSVRRRADTSHLIGESARVGVAIGLSTGFDSGAVHAAMLKLGLSHSTFSMRAREDPQLLKERFQHTTGQSCARYEARRSRPLRRSGDAYKQSHANCASSWLLQQSARDHASEVQWSVRRVERHRYFGTSGSNLQDPATAGASAICRNARKRKHRALLSAAGADEQFSDYGNRGMPDNGREWRTKPRGRFYGFFPETLSDIFPWSNLILGSQRDFLMKEELVAGAHGMEGRYVFLDRKLVQEFLWLSQSVKNQHYKAPVHMYLASNHYPFNVPIHTETTSSPSSASRFRALLNEFRTGFVAGDGLLASRQSVITGFSSCSKNRNIFKLCWARVMEREETQHLIKRWQNDFIHDCAVGNSAGLKRSFRRCLQPPNLTRGTDFEAHPAKCAELYMLARRDGLTCLDHAAKGRSFTAVRSVLDWAVSVGVCEDSSCGCRAANWPKGAKHPYWQDKLVNNCEVLLVPSSPRFAVEDSGCDVNTLLDKERVPISNALAPAPGPCTNECAKNEEMLALMENAPMMVENVGFFAVDCARASGVVAEIGFRYRGYVRRQQIEDKFNRSTVADLAVVYMCLPPVCLNTCVVHPQDVIHAIWKHSIWSKGMKELQTPLPGLDITVARASLIKGSEADKNVQSILKDGTERKKDGGVQECYQRLFTQVKVFAEAGRIASLIDDGSLCYKAFGSVVRVKVRLKEYWSRRTGDVRLARYLEPMRVAAGGWDALWLSLETSTLCIPAACVGLKSGLKHATWLSFFSQHRENGLTDECPPLEEEDVVEILDVDL